MLATPLDMRVFLYLIWRLEAWWQILKPLKITMGKGWKRKLRPLELSGFLTSLLLEGGKRSGGEREEQLKVEVPITGLRVHQVTARCDVPDPDGWWLLYYSVICLPSSLTNKTNQPTATSRFNAQPSHWHDPVHTLQILQASSSTSFLTKLDDKGILTLIGITTCSFWSIK